MSEHTETLVGPLVPFFSAGGDVAAPVLAARESVADSAVLSSIAAVFSSPLDLGLDLLLPGRPSFVASVDHYTKS